MTVGNQPSQVQINQSLTTFSVAMRDLMQNIANLNLTVAELGLAGLEALGYSADDAALVISQAAILNTMAAVYFGTATQATDYNFNSALCGLWAGA